MRKINTTTTLATLMQVSINVRRFVTHRVIGICRVREIIGCWVVSFLYKSHFKLEVFYFLIYLRLFSIRTRNKIKVILKQIMWPPFGTWEITFSPYGVFLTISLHVAAIRLYLFTERHLCGLATSYSQQTNIPCHIIIKTNSILKHSQCIFAFYCSSSSLVGFTFLHPDTPHWEPQEQRHSHTRRNNPMKSI